MRKYATVNITKEDLIRTVYFILMKYKADLLHMQGTSAKRDLVGGFIERWLNKLAETSVFDYLLKEKEYKAIPDYFLYGKDKDAPDILGIKDHSKTIPFVQFNNNGWDTVLNSPRIEVKALRKGQYVLGVREPQMIDDYYVFVESDLELDYLALLFEDSVFGDENFNLLKVDSSFIKSDIHSNIFTPIRPKKPENIGTFTLIGTYTRDQVQKHTVLCKPKICPFYAKTISNAGRVSQKARRREKILVDNGKFTYKFKKVLYLPLAISGDTSTAYIVKKNKGSCYIETDKDISINGVRLAPGFIKIQFNKFERNSKWSENMAVINSFEIFAKDSTSQMINHLDEIYRKMG